jgi:nitrilase
MMQKLETADELSIGFAQIAPVWLDRTRTLEKVLDYANQAARQGCRLLAFGEAIVPGYPFWVERTEGARFNSPVQKEIYAHYVDQAVQVEAGHLDELCTLAAQSRMAVMLGTIERAPDRGGHSLYCSLVTINDAGVIASVHRKLMPTYEERLVWSPGDGHGLQVHKLGAFHVGGLNCWENWMPLVRAALYGLGEDLHVAVWPGGSHNTRDTTPFIAKEGRSYVLAASGLMRREDITPGIPHYEAIYAGSPEVLANGGSCLVGPDGEWLIEPVVGKEALCLATIDHKRVREERQNFDPAGHYSRPDVTRLTVDRRRQSTLSIEG